MYNDDLMGRECKDTKNNKEVPTKICPVCGYKGKPILKLKGNTYMEIFLWVLLIVPGLVYSIWRHSGACNGCPKCVSDTMIPLCTPLGQKTAEEFTPVSISSRNRL